VLNGAIYGLPATAPGSAPSSRATVEADQGLYSRRRGASGAGHADGMMIGWIAADSLDQDLGGRGMSAAAREAGLPDAFRMPLAAECDRGPVASSRRRASPSSASCFGPPCGTAAACLRAHWGAPRPGKVRAAGDLCQPPVRWDGVAFMCLVDRSVPGLAHVHPDGARQLVALNGFMRARRLRHRAQQSARARRLLRTAQARARRSCPYALDETPRPLFCDVRERPVPSPPALPASPSWRPRPASLPSRSNHRSGPRRCRRCWPHSPRPHSAAELVHATARPAAQRLRTAGSGHGPASPRTP
jgi:hypothetical protein